MDFPETVAIEKLHGAARTSEMCQEYDDLLLDA